MPALRLARADTSFESGDEGANDAEALHQCGMCGGVEVDGARPARRSSRRPEPEIVVFVDAVDIASRRRHALQGRKRMRSRQKLRQPP